MNLPPPEDAVARQIVDAALRVHRTLGPGLLESVYELSLAYELRQRGLRVLRQVAFDVTYGPLRFEGGFKADLVVNGLVIVELKSVERLMPVHKKQTLTYLKMANLRLALLLNFGEVTLKQGIKRITNNLPEP
jgi:GxxExxY protein